MYTLNLLNILLPLPSESRDYIYMPPDPAFENSMQYDVAYLVIPEKQAKCEHLQAFAHICFPQ